MKKIILKIKGMHCESCAKMIKDLFEEKGAIAVVDFKRGIAKVSCEENIKIDEILKDIEKRGYRVYNA